MNIYILITAYKAVLRKNSLTYLSQLIDIQKYLQ